MNPLDLMPWWAWIAPYLLVGSVVCGYFMRWSRDNVPRCHGLNGKTPQSVGYCRSNHVPGCCEPTGEIDGDDWLDGAVIGALWLPALLPLIAYRIATHKESRIVTRKRIAELEAENAAYERAGQALLSDDPNRYATVERELRRLP